MSDPGRDLLALVPRISRARGFRLYTEGGRRLVDLWQYGGAAALGHTAPGVLLAFKDSASRGLFAPLPHAAAARLEKTILRLVPGYTVVRLYADTASADAALASAGLAPLRCSDLPDPTLVDLPPGVSAALWRPWAPESAPLPPVISPMIPLPWSGRPVAFLLDPAFADRFPPSDVLSPVVLTAACRAVDDLIAALPLRAQLRFRHTETALSGSGTAWRRRGPYLRLAQLPSADEYASLFHLFLEAGFLLPPDPASPAILPLELSPGEDARLAALLSRATSKIL